MRLIQINLSGFKSFVDPTKVLLPSKITVIVGPNGCGKSNVIDAVRWVMGESSAKNLRGDSLVDVIFNGSTGRKPVGQASIELIFDNSDGSLGGEYAAYAQISVRRQLTRDGQSTYFLNNTRCRRRDITDLFLGTGLGPRSYAIIEQGTISRLIEARPEELRQYLEEVAGISKYKERRRETETRIRHTRENLDRLSDLRQELEKQLERLKRQASAAERFNELKAEAGLLKGQLYALRYQAFSERLEFLQTDVQEKDLAIEAANTELSRAAAVGEQLRESQIDAGDEFNRVQERFYKIGSQISRLEQTLAHHRERGAQWTQDQADVERDLEALKVHERQDQGLKSRLSEELEAMIPELELTEQQSETSHARLVEVESTMQDWQMRWDEFNQSSSEVQREAQVMQARIQHLEEQIDGLDRALLRKQEELARLEENPLDDTLESLNENILVLTEQEEEERSRMEILRGQITELRQANDQRVNDIAQRRTHLQQQQGRYASLEALQQAALGQQEDGTVQWLETQKLADHPRLAQKLQVESGWEFAVETVLGFHLQSICVANLSEFAGVLPALEKGQLGLVAATSAENTQGRLGKTLLDSVHANQEWVASLAYVYVADDLGTALDLSKQLLPHESVITSDALWLGHGWARLNRTSDAKAGVIAREKELQHLASILLALQEEDRQQNEALEEGRLNLQEFEQERERLQRNLNQLGTQLSDARAQLRVQQTRLEHQRKRFEELQQEREEQQERRMMYQDDLEKARHRWEAALESLDEKNEMRQELSMQRDQCRQDVDQARDQSKRNREALHQLNLRVQGHRTQLQSLEQNYARTLQQLAHLEQRKAVLANMIVENAAPIEGLQEELELALSDHLTVEADLAQARKHLEEVEHQLRTCEQTRQHVESRIQTLRQQSDAVRMEWQELQVRRQTIEEQLQEMNYVLEALMAQMPEDATLQEHEAELTRVEEKIARLGAINLAAIEELKTEAERKTYLDQQNADLEEALATLEQAIEKIDKETKVRFEETFNQVNLGLQQLFPKIFGGGRAYLEMTGDDLLNTGITVMAQPPGKRNSTIHLLSGGEKALTAMALVFSLFQLNPAPFCMLDEVDAPLDDANVFRFCNLVKEMAEKVQFIVISHNKVTMEMAHHLSGVTMHEPGVSRIVSVDVEAAVALATA